MIEKIKKFLPQSAGKFISEGQILKILLGVMPLDPPPPPPDTQAPWAFAAWRLAMF